MPLPEGRRPPQIAADGLDSACGQEVEGYSKEKNAMIQITAA
jgi:hypothetical protein